MTAESIFDETVLREITEAAGMAPIELIDLFLEDMSATLDQLHGARAARDAALLGRLAHTLKSSAGNVGATEVTRLSRELEAHSKQGFDATSEALCSELLNARDAFVGLIEGERARLTAI